MNKNPIIICSPPVPITMQIINFGELLSEILKNRQRIKENFKHQPHTDIVMAKKNFLNTVIILHKFYYKEDDHWIEETSKFLLLKSELTNKIHKILDSVEPDEEIDITEFIEVELDNFNRNCKGGIK